MNIHKSKLTDKTKKSDGVTKPERISSYFKIEVKVLIITAISGILYNIGMIAGPYYEGQLVLCLYDVTNKKRTFYDMCILAIVYVVVIMFVQGMRSIKRFYVRRFANDTSRNMREILYNSLVYKKTNELEDESAGSIMTKAIADIDACTEGMRKFTTEIFDTGVVLIAYLAMLFYYDWRLTLISSAFIPFAYIGAEIVKNRIYTYNRAYKEGEARLNNKTLDRISNAITYRVFGCESQKNDEYEAILDKYEKKAVAANIWENTLQPLYLIISMSGVIFIVIYGSKNIAGNGWTAWNIASFTTFLSCFTKMAAKSSHAAKLFNSVQKASVSWKRIKPLMKEKTFLCKATDVNFDELVKLRVDNLSYAYKQNEYILNNVSFEAMAGQIIGVTGPIACGKSTLGKVFLCEKEYDGSICINDRELSSYSEYERSIILGYMGHQSELISGTIQENIKLGENKDVSQALNMVSLDKEMDELEDGTDTYICGDRPILSGGQQARLMLARTIYNKHNLLVLDDPFASVDIATEREIINNIRKKYNKCIVIIISHRIMLFDTFDKVIWIEDGNAFTSNHKEMMESNEKYKKFYNMQTKGVKDYDEE